MAKCKSCNQDVEWAVTDRAKAMLVQRDRDGVMYAWHTASGELRVSANKPKGPDTFMVTSHFATCPKASSHRSRR